MPRMAIIISITSGRICLYSRGSGCPMLICPCSYPCNMALLPLKVTLPKPMLRIGVKGYVTVTVTGLLVNALGSMSFVSMVCVNPAVLLIEMVTWLGLTGVVPSIVAPTIVFVTGPVPHVREPASEKYGPEPDEHGVGSQ